MTARDLTLNLGGRWCGSYGTAACPVCQPSRRRDQHALTLSDGRDGRLLAHCKRAGCDFRDILSATPGSYTPDPAAVAAYEAERKAQAEKKAKQARAIWDETQPIGGTPAETYLRGRGITCDLCDVLRFHPACWHPTAKRFPAMVARIDGGDGFAVHRTYLRPDGSGKADAEPAKAMLGAASGGAVRLTGGSRRLVVAEGIETALSLACGLLDGPATIWAALSTSGIRGLHLPRIAQIARIARAAELIVAPDGDAPGRAAAVALADQAHALGWRVSTLEAPEGCDFNDLLTEKGDAA